MKSFAIAVLTSRDQVLPSPRHQELGSMNGNLDTSLDDVEDLHTLASSTHRDFPRFIGATHICVILRVLGSLRTANLDVEYPASKELGFAKDLLVLEAGISDCQRVDHRFGAGDTYEGMQIAQDQPLIIFQRELLHSRRIICFPTPSAPILITSPPASVP